MLDVATGTDTVVSGKLNSLRWSPSNLVPNVATAPTYPIPTPDPTPDQLAEEEVLEALESLGRPPAGTTVRSLLAEGGTVLTFRAPSAGALSVVWSLESGAVASAKRVPLATARKTLPAAGKTKVRLRLTKAGRKALKRAKRSKRAVKVLSRAGFTPLGGTKTTTSKRFKLRG